MRRVSLLGTAAASEEAMGGCCPGVVVGADSRVRTCSETDDVKKTVSPGFLQAQDSGPH